MIPQEVADIAQIIADEYHTGDASDWQDFIGVAYKIYDYLRQKD